MEQNQTPVQKPGKLGKWAVAMGIIALLFALAPLASTWFVFLNWLAIPFAAIGLILGIIGVIKKHKKAIIGLILCAVAGAAYPLVLKSDYMEKKAAEDAAAAAEAVGSLVKMSTDLASESLN